MDDFLPEARIIPLGQPIDSAEILFSGSIEGARDFLQDMTLDDRAHIAIWTPGHVFTAAELEAERPGHEHDPEA